MFNPVRKTGKFVKQNYVPIIAFAIGAGVVAIYASRVKNVNFRLGFSGENMMTDNMAMMWNEFLKENQLYDTWDTHLQRFR